MIGNRKYYIKFYIGKKVKEKSKSHKVKDNNSNVGTDYQKEVVIRKKSSHGLFNLQVS